MDQREYGFKSEYAKSSRASCKACKSPIMKDTLRLAIMVQSPAFDGKIPNWFHYKCFWSRARVTDTNDIHGFDSLRWDDQEKINKALGGSTGGSGVGSNGAPMLAKTSTGAYKDYLTEYAKSGGSKCRGCGEKIPKGETRLGRKEYDSVQAKMYGPVTLWHHVDCFLEKREELEFADDMQPAKLDGYLHLRKEDKDMLIDKLGKGSATAKRKNDSAAGPKSKKMKTEDTEEQKEMREQNKMIWTVRDQLQRDVSNNALKALLEYNAQDIPAGESKLLDAVSDCMVFGGLVPCKECGGQFKFSSSGYRCTGDATEWTKCQVQVETPKRKAFKVPPEFHDVDVLKKYKYVKRDRVISKAAIVAAAASSAVSATGEIQRPLQGMKFVIGGKLGKSKADVSQMISKFGGEVVTKVNNKVAAVISTKEEITKKSKFLSAAKDTDTNVVDESFLNDISKGDIPKLILAHKISSWGCDPNNRIGDLVDGMMKSGAKNKFKSKMDARADAHFTKSVPSSMKMKLKGGAAVDPESGLMESAHVYKKGDDLYTAVLGLVSITSGTNSYYKLQLLESDSGKSYYLFRAWGRVGTTIGGNKLERFGGSLIGAMDQFRTLYGEKTGVDFDDRKSADKVPGKFYPLDIDFGAEEEDIKNLDASAGTNSKLDTAIQQLIRMIFDVESMKAAMLEFEIDLKKMPLGKLSKKQVQNAYAVLNEAVALVEGKGTATKFLDASNRFYTLIPHDFGMQKPPLLDNMDIIKTKTQMLDNLLEIEVAYNLMKGDGKSTGAERDPIDVHYEKLNTKMEVVDKKSAEFQRIVDYVKNTHASTHGSYELEVQEVYKVARDGERKRFKPFKALHNRQLLWHGSRTTNFAGILSQGLRIAPPEAPCTGYMFGKGIYFADMVSKSANYCFTSAANPIGLLGLCEVALGNHYERTAAEFVTKLPKGTHSTKGIGRTCPDPAGNFVTDEGLTIPMGKSTSSGVNHTSLLYNEYIVYDVAQVQFKYLLKTNFKYKSWF